MGAFDFAMDSLSSLASAFALPRGPGRNKINLNNYQLELDDSAKRVFAEFSIGMKMLYKHSVHNRFNLRSITEQNLKLLHNNLKSIQSYKKTINQIRSRSVESNHWAWIPLFNDQDINAGLLYLPAGHMVTPNIAGANVTIHQKSLHTPFTGAESSQNGHQLYLGLMGAASIECMPASSTGKGFRYNSRNVKTANQQPLITVNIRRDETFITDPVHSNVHCVSTSQAACLVLNVQFTPH